MCPNVELKGPSDPAKQLKIIDFSEPGSLQFPLTPEEYAEVVQLTEKISLHFSIPSYQYHKTGILAGQTVAHWHQHLVFVELDYSWISKISVLFRMAIAPALSLQTQGLHVRIDSPFDPVLQRQLLALLLEVPC